MPDWREQLLSDIAKIKDGDAILKKYPQLKGNKDLLENLYSWNLGNKSGYDEVKLGKMFPDVRDFLSQPIDPVPAPAAQPAAPGTKPVAAPPVAGTKVPAAPKPAAQMNMTVPEGVSASQPFVDLEASIQRHAEAAKDIPRIPEKTALEKLSIPGAVLGKVRDWYKESKTGEIASATYSADLWLKEKKTAIEKNKPVFDEINKWFVQDYQRGKSKYTTDGSDMGEIRVDAIRQEARKWAKRYGGGSGVEELIFASAMGAIELEQVKPRYEKEMANLYQKKYGKPMPTAQDIDLAGMALADAAKSKADSAMVAAQKELKLKVSETWESTYRKPLEEAAQQFGINSPQYKEQFVQSVAEIGKLEKQWRQKEIARLGRIKSELEAGLKKDFKALGSEEQMRLEAISQQAWNAASQGMANDRADKKYTEVAAASTLLGNAKVNVGFGRALMGRALYGLASLGDYLASEGYEAAAIDWMRSMATTGGELDVPDLEMGLDRNLAMALSTRVGGGIGSSALPMGAAMLTMNPLAGALVSYKMETAMMEADIWKERMMAGDPEAKQKADEAGVRARILLPLYVFQMDRLFKGMKKGGWVSKALNIYAPELAQELPTEYYQQYLQAKASGYDKDFADFVAEDKGNIALETAIATIGMSTVFSSMGQGTEAVGRALGQKAKDQAIASMTERMQQSVSPAWEELSQMGYFVRKDPYKPDGPPPPPSSGGAAGVLATTVNPVTAVNAALEQAWMNGEMTDEQLAVEKANAEQIFAKQEELVKLGVEPDLIQYYIGLQADVNRLKGEMAATEDPVIKAKIEKDISSIEGEMAKVIDDKIEETIFSVVTPTGEKYMVNEKELGQIMQSNPGDIQVTPVKGKLTPAEQEVADALAGATLPEGLGDMSMEKLIQKAAGSKDFNEQREAIRMYQDQLNDPLGPTPRSQMVAAFGQELADRVSPLAQEQTQDQTEDEIQDGTIDENDEGDLDEGTGNESGDFFQAKSWADLISFWNSPYHTIVADSEMDGEQIVISSLEMLQSYPLSEIYIMVNEDARPDKNQENQNPPTEQDPTNPKTKPEEESEDKKGRANTKSSKGRAPKEKPVDGKKGSAPKPAPPEKKSTQPPSGTKRQLRKEKKIQLTEKSKKALDEFRDAFNEFKNLGFADDAKAKMEREFRLYEAGARFVKSMVEQKIYELKDMVIAAYENTIEISEDFLRAIKKAYSMAYAEDESGLMEDPKTFRTKTVDDFLLDELDTDELDGFNNFRDNFRKELSELYVEKLTNPGANFKPLNVVDLRNMAIESGWVNDDGSSIPDNDIFEAVESVLIDFARGIVANANSKQSAMNNLLALYSVQPTISMRDSDRISMQQYSTPLPYAYAAGSWMDQQRKYLEPTAGNGLLTVAFSPSKVDVNELDDTRLNMLSDQGFASVTNNDALEGFTDGLPIRFKYDGIIANPPFGSTDAIKTEDGYPISELAQRIVYESLKTLTTDGKAAFIIGGHTEYDEKGIIKGRDRFFLNYLYNNFNVVDVINVSGDLYGKQGTTFPTRLILIDGRRSGDMRHAPMKSVPGFKDTGDPAPDDKVVSDYQELLNRVNAPRNEKIDLSSGMDSNSGTGNNISGNRSGKGNKGGSGGRNPSGKVSKPGKGVSQGGSQSGVSGNNAPGGNVSQKRKPKPDSTGNNDNPAIFKGQGNAVPAGAGPRPAIRPEVGRRDIQSDNSADPSRSFVGIRNVTIENLSQENVPYVPSSNVQFEVGTVIPPKMAVEVYRQQDMLADLYGNLADFVKSELEYTEDEFAAAFSAEQVDALAMAIHKAKTGAAMIIGDQTGVGKGRIAAGMVRWAVINGYKPIFITAKADLFSDFWRDLKDTFNSHLRYFVVNNGANVVEYELDESGEEVKKNVFKTPASASDKNYKRVINGQDNGFDFVMATYSQFQNERKSADKIGFARSVFEGGFFIMDESHNASGDSKTGELFQSFANSADAGMFLSATFAKRPDNMPIYATKTAMKDTGLDNEALSDAILNGGPALQEAVSAQLSESGEMIRRERDYTGVEVDYVPLDSDGEKNWGIKDQSEKHWNVSRDMSELMQDIINFQKWHVSTYLDGIRDAVSLSNPEMSITNTPFASKIFNINKQMLLALKADAAADLAIKELKEGKKPVISLAYTMESFLNEELEVGDVVPQFDFSGVMLRGLEGTLKTRTQNGFGNVTVSRIEISSLPEESQKAYWALVKKIKDKTIDLNASPIDHIIKRIEDAGYSVGELTGRSTRLVAIDGGLSLVKYPKRDKKEIVRQFNSGKLDVILMNKSVAVGISMHASQKFSDQRQRVMIIAEPELDINDEIQKRGRIDRTGQVLRGAYRYLVSTIPSEQRLMMMFKKKAASLDANAKATQENKANKVEVVDFLNKYGDEIVFNYLLENEDFNYTLGDPLKIIGNEADAKPKSGDANKVTGRVAILSPEMQQRFYEDISSRYTDYMNSKLATGEWDLHSEVMKLNAEKQTETLLMEGSEKSPFSGPVNLGIYQIDVPKAPIKKEDLEKEIQEEKAGRNAGEYAAAIIDMVDEFYDAKKQAIKEDIEKRLLEKRAVIVAAIRKKMSENNAPQEEIERAVSEAEERNDLEVSDKINAEFGKADLYATRLKRYARFFYPGKSIQYPLGEGTHMVTHPGVFVKISISPKGISESDNIYRLAPSGVKFHFAIDSEVVRDSRPATSNDFLYSVVENTQANPSDNLSNWGRFSGGLRRKAGIVTGNLLRGYGTVRMGRVVNFTTNTGEIEKGILLPFGAGVSENLSNSRIVPLTRAIQVLFGKVGDIGLSLEKSRISVSGDSMQIEVPLSKRAGGAIFLNKEILDKVYGGRFVQRGQYMVATAYGKKDMVDVAAALEKMGITATVDNKHFKDLDNKLSRLSVNTDPVPVMPTKVPKEYIHSTPISFAKMGIGVNDTAGEIVDKMIAYGGPFTEILKFIRALPEFKDIEILRVENLPEGHPVKNVVNAFASSDQGVYFDSKEKGYIIDAVAGTKLKGIVAINQGITVNAYYTVTHELMHFLTLDGINSSDKAVKEKLKRLEDIFLFIKSKRDKWLSEKSKQSERGGTQNVSDLDKLFSGVGFQESYGMKDFKEFMVELLMNPVFRANISNVVVKSEMEFANAIWGNANPESRSILTIIKDYIRSLFRALFGKSSVALNSSLVDQAVALAEDIFFSGETMVDRTFDAESGVYFTLHNPGNLNKVSRGPASKSLSFFPGSGGADTDIILENYIARKIREGILSDATILNAVERQGMDPKKAQDLIDKYRKKPPSAQTISRLSANAVAQKVGPVEMPEKERKLNRMIPVFDPQGIDRINENATKYLPKSTKISMDEAEKFIANIDTADLRDFTTNVHSVLNTLPIDVQTAIRIQAILRMQNEVVLLREAGKHDEADRVSEDSMEIWNHMTPLSTAMGRAVNLYKMLISSPVFSKLTPQNKFRAFLSMAERGLARKLTELERKTLFQLFQVWDAAPDGIGKQIAMAKALAYINSLRPLNTWDLLTNIWYSKILSGPITHWKNITSNIINGPAEMFVQSLALGKKYKSNPGAIFVRLFNAWWGGLKRGYVEARYISLYGPTKEESTKFYQNHLMEEITWETTNMPSFWKKVLNSPVLFAFNPKVLRYVGRMLAAEDALLQNAGESAFAEVLAYLEAAKSNKGADKKLLMQMAKAMMATDGLSYSKAEQQALDEARAAIDMLRDMRSEAEIAGDERQVKQLSRELAMWERQVNGKAKNIAFKKRVYEILEAKANDTEEGARIALEAAARASKVTYNFPPKGLFTRTMYDVLVFASEKILPFKFFVPFVRIVSNLVDNYLNYSPVGFVTPLISYVSPGANTTKDEKGARPLTDEERTEMMIKAMIGTMTWIFLYNLAVPDDDDDEPWFTITGAGPGDQSKIYEAQETGWRPYSIITRDGAVISYKETPFYSLLASIGSINDELKFGKKELSEKDIWDKMSISASGFVKSIFDNSWMQGLDELLNSAKAENKFGKLDFNIVDKFVKKGTDVAGAFVQSNLSKQIVRMHDRIREIPMKKAETPFERIITNMPIVRGVLPHEITDVWGDPVVNETYLGFIPLRIQTPEKDDVISLLVKNGVWIGRPRNNKEIYDGDVLRPMDNDEYYRYHTLASQKLKAILQDPETINFLTEMDAQKNVDAIKTFIQARKQNANQEAFMELFGGGINSEW